MWTACVHVCVSCIQMFSDTVKWLRSAPRSGLHVIHTQCEDPTKRLLVSICSTHTKKTAQRSVSAHRRAHLKCTYRWGVMRAHTHACTPLHSVYKTQNSTHTEARAAGPPVVFSNYVGSRWHPTQRPRNGDVQPITRGITASNKILFEPPVSSEMKRLSPPKGEY